MTKGHGNPEQGGFMKTGELICDSQVLPPTARGMGADDFQAGELTGAISMDHEKTPPWDDAWIDLGGEA
jgi:hypothetical protein